MSRVLKVPWLDAYRKFTANIEAPDSFNKWVGISTVASALQRKVWVKFEAQHVTLYPSLFIVLTSNPGVCRKGSAINPSLDLLRDVEGPLHIIANDVTRQKILKEMSENPIETFLHGGEILKHCSVTCVAEEFSTLLGVKDIELLATLTALWNCDSEYKYSTKGSGEHLVHNVFVNILAGTTPQWLQSSLPLEAIGGGFTSRIIFVVEEHNPKVSSFTDLDIKAIPDDFRNALLTDLRAILKLRGEMVWSPDAGKWYDSWYKTFRNAKPDINDERFHHYLSRKPAMAWKVAMCLVASEGDTQTIEASHLEQAVELLEELEPMMPKAFGGMGTSDLALGTNKVWEYLRANPHGLNEQQLMGLTWQHVRDRETLNIIIGNLKLMGVVDEEQSLSERVFRMVEGAEI